MGRTLRPKWQKLKTPPPGYKDKAYRDAVSEYMQATGQFPVHLFYGDKNAGKTVLLELGESYLRIQSDGTEYKSDVYERLPQQWRWGHDPDTGHLPYFLLMPFMIYVQYQIVENVIIQIMKIWL